MYRGYSGTSQSTRGILDSTNTRTVVLEHLEHRSWNDAPRDQLWDSRNTPELSRWYVYSMYVYIYTSVYNIIYIHMITYVYIYTSIYICDIFTYASGSWMIHVGEYWILRCWFWRWYPSAFLGWFFNVFFPPHGKFIIGIHSGNGFVTVCLEMKYPKVPKV